MKTQKDRILEAIESRPGLTHLELTKLLNLPAPSKRISELNLDLVARGIEIVNEPIPGTSYGGYYLRKIGGEKWQSVQSVGIQPKQEGQVIAENIRPNTCEPIGKIIENTAVKSEETLCEKSARMPRGFVSEVGYNQGTLLMPEKEKQKETKYRMYRCAKGHRAPYYGEPEPKVKCAECNYQEWAVMV